MRMSEFSRGFAAGPGGGFREARALGHISADSGLGDWPQGRDLLTAFVAAGVVGFTRPTRVTYSWVHRRGVEQFGSSLGSHSQRSRVQILPPPLMERRPRLAGAVSLV